MSNKDTIENKISLVRKLLIEGVLAHYDQDLDIARIWGELKETDEMQ